jgi:hypothetical protein
LENSRFEKMAASDDFNNVDAEKMFYVRIPAAVGESAFFELPAACIFIPYEHGLFRVYT